MQKNVVLVIAVIASLAIGGGGVYAISFNQVTTLTNEKADLLTQVAALSSDKNQLQSQVNSLTDERTTLQTQISTLNAEKTSLQTQVSSLTSENTDLTARYDLIAETIDAMHSSNWTRTATYNITAWTVMTQSFVMDKFGIVWESVVDFSGTSVSVGYYYWYKGERIYLTSYSKSLITQNNPGITYYGPQDYLYGTIKLDISKDYRVANRIWVSYTIFTQFPDVRMGGNSSVDLDS